MNSSEDPGKEPENSSATLVHLPISRFKWNSHIQKGLTPLVCTKLEKSEEPEFEGREKDIVKYFQSINQREQNIQEFMRQQTSARERGRYNFFNYVSKASIYCEISQQPVPLIAYYIFSNDFELAVAKLREEDLQMHTNMKKTLEIVLSGLIMLKKIIMEDSNMSYIFYHRSSFAFSGYNLPIKPAKEIMFGQKELPWIYQVDDIEKFILTLKKHRKFQQRMDYVYHNMLKLRDLLKYISKKKLCDYLELIFLYLENLQDQTKTDGFYNYLMYRRNLVITDRLNYAQRLLNEDQRRRFISELEGNMLRMTNLTNLLLFPMIKDDISKFQHIIQNYLDEFGDLQTIAWVCLAYGNRLMKYVDMYHEKLIMVHEEDEAEKLECEKTQKLHQLNLQPAPRPNKLRGLYLDMVNLQTEKLELSDTLKDNALKKLKSGAYISSSERKDQTKLCFICFKERKIGKSEQMEEDEVQESFIECNKCRHGGHLNHLLKWYEETRMCPKNDCSCQCN